MKVCRYCKHSFKNNTSRQQYCCVQCANKANNIPRHVNLPAGYCKELAELVGIILGDGTLFGYQLKITLNSNADKYYIPYVCRLIRYLFGQVSLFVYPRASCACTDIAINSKIVVDYFVDMGIVSGKPVVPFWIFTNDSYRAACVKGLMDTEGCISFKKYTTLTTQSIYKQLTFTSKNLVLLDFVIETFNLLNYKCTQSRIKNIYLSSPDQITRYNTEIGFGNPKLRKLSQIKTYSDYLCYLEGCRSGLSGMS